MLSQHSPFLNIPVGINHTQAVFLDGIRHAVEIIDLSYARLCQSLTQLACGEHAGPGHSKFTHVFLDAWAFVDAVDRFRNLWAMQPNADRLPEEYSSASIRSQLQDVRNVRNVSAHVGQKIDQIVSLNSSILGAINWVTLIDQSPLKIKSFFIRPGIASGMVKGQLAMPKGEVSFVHGSGYVTLAAGKHSANLSEAHDLVSSVVRFAESAISFKGQKSVNSGHLPRDVFGSADLDTSALWNSKPSNP